MLFGANLARIRREAGFSQDEMGLRAEVHRTEISQLERGLRCPRIDTVLKLAGTLEIEPGDLLVSIVWKAAEHAPGRFECPGEDASL